MMKFEIYRLICTVRSTLAEESNYYRITYTIFRYDVQPAFPRLFSGPVCIQLKIAQKNERGKVWLNVIMNSASSVNFLKNKKN